MKKRLSMLAIACGLLAGCAKEPASNVENTLTATVTASISGVSGGDDVVNEFYRWAEGDSILLCEVKDGFFTGNNLWFEYTGSGGASGSFVASESGTGLAEGCDYVAVHTRNWATLTAPIDNVNATMIIYDMATEWTQPASDNLSWLRKYALFMAGCITASENTSLNFSSPLTLVKCMVSDPNSTGAVLTSLSINTPGEKSFANKLVIGMDGSLDKTASLYAEKFTVAVDDPAAVLSESGYPVWSLAVVKNEITPAYLLVCNSTDPYPLSADAPILFTDGALKELSLACETNKPVVPDIMDFTDKPAANSYMIQPSPTLNALNVIIPISRINDYWGETTTDGYGATPANMIAEGSITGWVADILWADFDWKGRVVARSTSGATGGVGDNLQISFPATETQVRDGNFVVGVRPASPTADCPEGKYLWSWHIWVTPYNPDATPAQNGRTDLYAGQTKVMMDRNLGDISNDTANGQDKGFLVYQFGRKDPFGGNAAWWLSDGSPKAKCNFVASVQSPNVGLFPLTVNPQKIADVVRAPMTSIGSTSNGATWMLSNSGSAEANNFSTGIWGDLKVPAATPEVGKSIFDPCPPGWKVPPITVWNDMRIAPGLGATQTGPLSSIWITTPAEKCGRWYSGNGTVTAQADNTDNLPIFYPANGSRVGGNTGNLQNNGLNVQCWSNQASATMGYYLNTNLNNVFAANVTNSQANMAVSFAVRCIQE